MHPRRWVTSQVIKDFSVSFYEAGLVPAAHVHLSPPQQQPDAAVLRSEVAALQASQQPRSLPRVRAGGSLPCVLSRHFLCRADTR